MIWPSIVFQEYLRYYPYYNHEIIYDVNYYFYSVINLLINWLEDKYKESNKDYYIFIVWYIYYALSNQLITPDMSTKEMASVYSDMYNHNPVEFSKCFDTVNNVQTNIYNIVSVTKKIINNPILEGEYTTDYIYMYVIPFNLGDNIDENYIYNKYYINVNEQNEYQIDKDEQLKEIVNEFIEQTQQNDYDYYGEYMYKPEN